MHISQCIHAQFSVHPNINPFHGLVRIGKHRLTRIKNGKSLAFTIFELQINREVGGKRLFIPSCTRH